jgi:hypothetical protein
VEVKFHAFLYWVLGWGECPSSRSSRFILEKGLPGISGFEVEPKIHSRREGQEKDLAAIKLRS